MVYAAVTTTVTNYSASITTLCDGYPRIVGNLTSTGTWTRSGLNYSTVAYPGPMPSCKINPDDCAAYRTLWSAAARAHAALASATATTFVTIDPAATALTTGNDILGYSTVTLQASNGSFPTLIIGKATYAPSPPGSVQGCAQCSTESYWKVKAFQRQGYASYAAMPPGANWLVIAEKQAWSGSWQAPQCTVSATTANSDICGPCTVNGGTVQLL
ncbi:hypothetical protein EJ03DRAFT_200550 [Teratosphaeria nubilosa]|uniref:Uncharacterized protein n=1 Tax=Teratosphaeria nubilosa TaxID=161662 RepID=A0A6G1LJC6_9PEZI|nr:hypothetical protein EJ03DRAFT_200550 [Teratosphaeria nubilosa]